MSVTFAAQLTAVATLALADSLLGGRAGRVLAVS